MLAIIKLILALILLIFGAAFAIINDALVTLDLYFFATELPLSVVLLLFMIGGIVLGGIASLGYFARIKKENSNLKRQSRLATQEIDNLRTLPVKGR